MKVMVWTRDEGQTDLEFKDGDIFQVHPDSWEPGAKETQRWLVVQMPDYQGDLTELTASEFAAGPGTENVVRRMRKYRLNYVPKLTPEELEAARDPDTAVEVIVGRYELSDIIRK